MARRFVSLLALTSILVAGCPAVPSGPPCTTDSDCLVAGQHCEGGGVCTSACGPDQPCPTGTTCEEGNCTAESSDGGTMTMLDSGWDAGEICRSDMDCADDVFCNGAESCSPDAAGARADGCAPGTPPCTGGATCDESGERCTTSCEEDMDGNGRIDADNDGDGHRSIACGPSGSVPGDDCDDADADRFPRTSAEVCDDAAPGHDEDCDPCTVSDYLADDGDDDGDGFVSETCSNPLREADDPSTFTCPGTINEFTRLRAAERTVTGNDCNDTPGAGNGIDPGVAEICNDVDDNCDGLVDEEMPGRICDCLITDMPQRCGDTEVGECTFGMQDCIDGRWGGCVGVVTPRTEVCNGADDDCNGTIDDGLRINCYLDSDGDRWRNAGDGTLYDVCRDNSRDAAGYCPVGYVAPSSNQGDDCSNLDITRFRNDTWRIDGDGDQRCLGSTAICGNGSPPPGYRADGSCLSTGDCNDANNSVFQTMSCRRDIDNDGYCWASSESFCTTVCPSGYRAACSGVDAYDLNSCLWDASQQYVYSQCDAGPFACPSGGVSCSTDNCPYGYHPIACEWGRLPGSQSGFGSVGYSGDVCRLALTCNVFDSARGRATLTCEADTSWGGGCGDRP